MSINAIKNQTGAQSILKFIYLFFLGGREMGGGGRGGNEKNGVRLRLPMSSNLLSPHQTGHEPGNRGLSNG